VPLYAVETIRMLSDRGVLRLGENAYELVGDLGELHVPETLHALIASRLDALEPEDRALLQDATVLGKSFTLDALSAVTGADTASLDPRLLGLVRKEFLIHEADPRSPERGQYGFVQSIIREVGYGMLSKADRRSRHLATAHHFEAAGDDEIAGVVAAHYLEALRATPEGPDADALAARARDWLGQAAERATSLGSPQQALVFAEQALAITPDGRERAELLEEAARAAADSLRPEDQINYLEQAIAVHRAAEDVNAEVATMGVLVDAMGDLGRRGRASELVKEMRERLGDGGDDRARGELEYATGTVQYFDEDFEGCLASLDRAGALFEAAEAWERHRRAMTNKSYLLQIVGRRRESKLLTRGLMAVATDEGNLRAMAASAITLSLQAEEMRESLDRSLEAAEIARRGGYGVQETISLANAVEIAAECGEWKVADEVLANLRERADLPARHADSAAIGAALLAAYRGKEQAAAAELLALTPTAVDAEDPTMRSWVLRVRSVVSLMAGERARAYDEAMAAIEAEPGGPNAPIAVWGAGRAALAMRDPAKARAPLERSIPFDGTWAEATRRAIEAGIHGLEGRDREASSAYDAVLSGRLAMGDRFTHALITIDAVAVLPPELVPAGAIDTASAFLEEIGAGALLASLKSEDVPALTER
jgi:tetratricopeptide (TPR) repeat protein